jgi:uncharacterized protein (DUF58 family)
MSLGDPPKFDYARRLAAALVYVGLVRHDSILLQPFHARLEESTLASGGRHRFGPVNDYLAVLETGGPASLATVARQFINAYPKPGLLVLISDFLDDGEVLKPLQYLADFGHELLLVQIWTPEDREPGLAGEILLEDAESHAAGVEDMANRTGGRYAGFSTSVPLEEAVFSALDRAGADLAGRAV